MGKPTRLFPGFEQRLPLRVDCDWSTRAEPLCRRGDRWQSLQDRGRPTGSQGFGAGHRGQDAYAKAHRINVEEDKPSNRDTTCTLNYFGATEKEAVGAINPPASALSLAAVEANQANLQ